MHNEKIIKCEKYLTMWFIMNISKWSITIQKDNQQLHYPMEMHKKYHENF